MIIFLYQMMIFRDWSVWFREFFENTKVQQEISKWSRKNQGKSKKA